MAYWKVDSQALSFSAQQPEVSLVSENLAEWDRAVLTALEAWSGERRALQHPQEKQMGRYAFEDIPLGNISVQSQQDTPAGDESEKSHNTKKLQYVSARRYVYTSTPWQYSEH